jgi:hypothetical protein
MGSKSDKELVGLVFEGFLAEPSSGWLQPPLRESFSLHLGFKEAEFAAHFEK